MSLLALLFALFSFNASEDGCHTAPTIKEGSRYRVELETHHQFKGTDTNLRLVWVYTKNRRFADWVSRCKARPEEWIEDYSKNFDCVDIFEPVLFANYERSLGLYLQHRYWKKTKRWVPIPDIFVHMRVDEPIRCYIP
jgi:hypothetical protein